jgi:hypothetical protein
MPLNFTKLAVSLWQGIMRGEVFMWVKLFKNGREYIAIMKDLGHLTTSRKGPDVEESN